MLGLDTREASLEAPRGGSGWVRGLCDTVEFITEFVRLRDFICEEDEAADHAVGWCSARLMERDT